MSGASKRVLVVSPTYNERDNLPSLVEAIMQLDGYRLMVVDDGSPDGTGKIADDLAREHPGRIQVVHRTGLRGLGRSYVEGLGLAIRGEADVICQMDADLSHDPKHLPALVAATEQYDLVIGSRYIPDGAIVNWPTRRRWLSAGANMYIRLVTGLRPRDCTSGFRSWRREALARVPFHRSRVDGYAFLVEMLYGAGSIPLRIGERPITFVERRHGESKLSWRVLFESVVTPWRCVLGPRIRPVDPP